MITPLAEKSLIRALVGCVVGVASARPSRPAVAPASVKPTIGQIPALSASFRDRRPGRRHVLARCVPLLAVRLAIRGASGSRRFSNGTNHPAWRSALSSTSSRRNCAGTCRCRSNSLTSGLRLVSLQPRRVRLPASVCCARSIARIGGWVPSQLKLLSQYDRQHPGVPWTAHLLRGQDLNSRCRLQ